MKIGYIVHNLNDPAVKRRCDMLALGGASVKLAGFCRDAVITPDIAALEPLHLGHSADAALLSRVSGTLKNAVFAGRLKTFFKDCDLILARNLEQLAIGARVAKTRPLVYECLDIHRLLVGQGALSKLVQTVEAGLLRKIDLLLTSSPAFLREHFDKKSLSVPTYLIENKLFITDQAVPVAKPASPQTKLCIGWFGMLRCKKTLEVLTELAAKAEGRIDVLIAGKPSPSELPNFEQEVASREGLTFVGAYTYDDLQDLYGKCHFAWSIDWFEEGLNSKWLLSNRLYESLSYGAVPITLLDTELGRWLTEKNVGLTVSDEDDVMQTLLTLTPQDIQAYQEAALALDRGAVIAAAQDCKKLVAVMSETLKS